MPSSMPADASNMPAYKAGRISHDGAAAIAFYHMLSTPLEVPPPSLVTRPRGCSAGHCGWSLSAMLLSRCRRRECVGGLAGPLGRA